MRLIPLALTALISLSVFSLQQSLAASEASALVLNGKFTQGSLFRGQLPPGSQVTLNGEALKLNAQGKFVFGFARESALKHTLSWTLPDGTPDSRDIELDKRQYNLQRIDGL